VNILRYLESLELAFEGRVCCDVNSVHVIRDVGFFLIAWGNRK
jgi:hypothetical protein